MNQEILEKSVIVDRREATDKIALSGKLAKAINSALSEHIEFSVYTNHMSGDINDLIVFFGTVGKIAEESYGLLYIRNDEDRPKKYVVDKILFFAYSVK